MFKRAWIPALLLTAIPTSADVVTSLALVDAPVEIRGENNVFPSLVVYGNQGLTLRIGELTASEWKQGDIRGYDLSPQGDQWIWLNGRIQQSSPNSGGDLIDRTEPFELFRKTGRIFVTRLGDVWVSGARKMRRHDGMFMPSGFRPEDNPQIQPRCDDAFGNIWAALVDAQGRPTGLAVKTFADPSTWQPVSLPSGLSDRWVGMWVDDVGFLWLATAQTLVQIDPRKDGETVIVYRPPPGQTITSVTGVANRQILVGFADGWIRELKAYPGKEPVMVDIRQMAGGPVRAMLEDVRGTLWSVIGKNLHRSQFLKQSWQRSWTEATRMPAGNHDNIFAAVGHKLYSAGGKTFFGYPASKWVNLDHLWSYDLRHSQWAMEPPMLEPGKAYSGIARLNEDVWIIGGYFRAEKGTKATDTVEIYDPERRRYRFGPKYPAPRGQIIAFHIKGRIYAVGGEGGNVASPEMFSIGGGESEWHPEPPAPAPVTQAAGCVIDNRIYLAAGPRSECPGLFVYDPKLREWSTVDHPAEVPPAAPLVAARHDEVWVMGGRGKSSGQVSVYGYSTKTRKWREGPDLPIPISWGAAATVNGRIMIAGGAYRAEAVGNYFNSDRVFFWNPK
jgi:hypothetical protein